MNGVSLVSGIQTQGFFEKGSIIFLNSPEGFSEVILIFSKKTMKNPRESLRTLLEHFLEPFRKTLFLDPRLVGTPDHTAFNILQTIDDHSWFRLMKHKITYSFISPPKHTLETHLCRQIGPVAATYKWVELQMFWSLKIHIYFEYY